jgi:hypothetical protein
MSDFLAMTAFDYQNRSVLMVRLPGFKRPAQIGGRAYQRSGRILASSVAEQLDASAVQSQKPGTASFAAASARSLSLEIACPHALRPAVAPCG